MTQKAASGDEVHKIDDLFYSKTQQTNELYFIDSIRHQPRRVFVEEQFDLFNLRFR